MTRTVSSKGSELSLRAGLLGVALSALLAAANAYLGLFAGMTVSASIPAAVVSMGLMRAVRGSILENNLVQTAASAGESAAAGAIFTLPALLLLGSWTSFPWLDCMLLVASGGVLGVIFTIFLRRPFVAEGQLPYPEGVATAEVLRSGHARFESNRTERIDPKLRALSIGGVFGGGFKLLESGFGVVQPVIQGAVRISGAPVYLGMGASPALLAVGFIVGLPIAIVVCLGGLINWLVVIPLIAVHDPTVSPLELAWSTWSNQTRYLGVGAMTFSGLYALFDLRRTLFAALRQGVVELRATSTVVSVDSEDLPFRWSFAGLVLCSGVLWWLFSTVIPSVVSSGLVTAFVLLISFLFSAVAAYMAGLLGSSNNPVSGVTIATIILVASLLLAVGIDSNEGAMATIFVGSVVCTAAAIGGDNMQDLKAGHLLGASPARQQVMQILGVLAAACVLGPALQLLSDSYGFFAVTSEHPRPLMAPQASLMAAVARGMFGGKLPWGLILGGAGLGAIFGGVDSLLKRRGSVWRAPPLALSLGMYLPLSLSTPVLLGGLAAHLARRAQAVGAPSGTGVLLSAGLITGEALMGIVVAALTLALPNFASLRLGWESTWLSLLAVAAVMLLLSRGESARTG